MKVAIKILNKKKIKAMEMDEKVRREIKILRLFMHPHIIRLYEVMDTASDIYVVMEYVKSGELFDYIVEKGRLMEDEARHFFQQIISGVEYCHRHMVVHRDLKPENILLDAKMNVKIADFGLSNVMRDGHFLKTSCGSPNYAAPEVISGKMYAGPEVDVWSCGVILYALLCGSLPFDDENIPNLFKKIKGGIYNLPSHLSPGARDLIPRMLLVDPMKRITILEVRQHPWFTVRLPRYLAVMQADHFFHLQLDADIVGEVCRLGFTREELLGSLKERHQNKATVAYYLLQDNKRRMQSAGYLTGQMEPQELCTPYTSGIMNRATNSRTPSMLHAFPAHRVVAERRWQVGIRCRAHPQHIMHEVYRTLQALNVTWKKSQPYNLKLRTEVRIRRARVASRGEGSDAMAEDMEGDSMKDADGADGNGFGGGEGAGEGTLTTHEVKLELQLYRTREGEYVVDLQLVRGEFFLFIDVCSAVLRELRI
ncbi:unnamed protein product [Pedinophyceae sp. YPF-701]|nr:unnamed protein product [Pedinophyceae sp. YPF-701]